MYLSELQNKDIISVKTGINLVAENKKIFRKVWKNSEITFTFNDISKIGTDCILVNK